jgi:aspartate aminotransferase
LGYAIVPESFIEVLLRYQQHTLVCVDPVTQFGGLVSIQNKDRHIKETIRGEVEEYRKRLDICEELIESTKIHLIRPEGSFYLCADVSAYLDETIPNSLSLAQQILNDINVAVTPGEDFGMDNFFRISLTSSRVIEGMERICGYLNKN